MHSSEKQQQANGFSEVIKTTEVHYSVTIKATI